MAELLLLLQGAKQWMILICIKELLEGQVPESD